MENPDLIKILERQVRFCEMAHENVVRDAQTALPILPPAFTPECERDMQHIGCPHLLYDLLYQDRQEPARGILYNILKDAKELPLLDNLQRYRTNLGSIDTCQRNARTGSSTLKELQTKPIPSIEAGMAAAKQHEPEYIDILEKIEELRPRILEIVRSHEAA